MVVGFLLLNYLTKSTAIQNIYLFNGILFFAIAVILHFIKLPEYKAVEQVDLKGSAFDFSHLRSGMLAIFFYVGAEVTIGGKLIEYIQLPEIGGLSENDATTYIGLYWGGAMVGRLAISVISSEKFNGIKRAIYGLFTVVLIYLALIFFITLKSKVLEQGQPLSFNAFAEMFTETQYMLWFVAFQYLGMLLFQNSSKKLLTLFSVIITLCLVVAFIYGRASCIMEHFGYWII